MTVVRRLARPMLAADLRQGQASTRCATPAARGRGRAAGRSTRSPSRCGLPGRPRAAGPRQRRRDGRRGQHARRWAASRACPPLVLAASLVPTTYAGHAFWQEHDPAKRAAADQHFLKNLGLLGGLLLASVDTAGKPGLSWRARRAAKDARAQPPRSASARPSRWPRAARSARREARLVAAHAHDALT